MYRFYIHKYEVSQCYGGPEEGGWWYDAGSPVENWSTICVSGQDKEEVEETALCVVRALNAAEYERREEENKYGYTSVLSYRDEFFEYGYSEDGIPHAYPEVRPHYE